MHVKSTCYAGNCDEIATETQTASIGTTLLTFWDLGISITRNCLGTQRYVDLRLEWTSSLQHQSQVNMSRDHGNASSPSMANDTAASPQRSWVPKSVAAIEKPKFEVWLEHMEDLWEDQKRREIGRVLHHALSSVDPRLHHSFILDLLDHSRDLRKRRPDSLCLLILKEFEAHLRYIPMSEKEKHQILTPELRMWAFHLAASSHTNIFDFLSRLYSLEGPDNSFLVSRIHVMLARQQFKEAALCVTKVKLQDHFSLEDICLPLIFQDKANLIEKYVQGRQPLQEALIKQLDAFCEQGFDINTFLSEMPHSVPGIRLERLRRRHLSKLILRLVKMFKLDMSLCPNTAKSKDMGAIRYLLHKRYIEMSMAPDVWDELVVSTIGDNQSVQVGLIEHLVWYNDVPAAACWARRYGLDADQLPDAVVQELQRRDSDSVAHDVTEAEEENWDEELKNDPAPDFYQLNVPDDRMFLVSTLGELQQCLLDIKSKPDAIVGIDMEWRPSFTPTQISKVSLCQVASWDAVYLLDMPALWTPDNQDVVIDFFVDLLQSEDIVKLGFDISGDYQMLGRSFPELQEAVMGQRRTIDLHGLGRQVIQKAPNPSPVAASSLGLSDLVFYCFGKYLDKRDRISDWQRRPLRQAQVQYAALDAFCLLEIYQFLTDKVARLGLNVNVEASLSSKKSKPKSKVKTKLPKPRDQLQSFPATLNEEPRGPPIHPGQLAVICDTMLQGLGHQLRSCGVDVKILDNDDKHEKAVEICRVEGRAILTSGAPYYMLKARVKEGQIMSVPPNKKARHQVQEVLDFFNVTVTPEDIFSRCQVCNGNVYAKVSNADMRRLWHQKQQRLTICSRPAIEVDYDDLDEDFDGMMICGDDDYYDDDDDYAPPAPKKNTASAAGSRLQTSTEANSCNSTSAMGQAASVVSNVPDTYTTLDADFDPSSVCTSVNQASTSTNPDGDESAGKNGRLTSKYMSNSSVVYLDDAINFETVTVGESVGLQVDSVPAGILDQIDTFFCCATCGKVFWEGKHFAHICSQFSHVLHRGMDRQGRESQT